MSDPASLQYPKSHLTWNLYGAGYERFGKKGKPERVLTIGPAPDQLLVRVDSVGICYSDVKLVRQGNQHPKIKGRNLRSNPTRPGHEVCFTVIKVGEQLKKEFLPGDRFAVQPEVEIGDQKQTYGFTFPGGLTQYQLIGPELLKTDQGVSLLKLEGLLGFSAEAVLEPWGSVLSAYDQTRRLIPKSGGNMWVIGGPLVSDGYDFSQYLDLPKSIVISDLKKDLVSIIQKRAQETVIRDGIGLTELEDFISRETQGQGFDDIVVLDPCSAAQIEDLLTHLNRFGLINLMGSRPLKQEIHLDPQRIHYDFISLVGSSGQDIAASYGSERNRSDLQEGGTAILLGGGGPIGQMHLQRAILRDNGPKTILVSEVNEDRIAYINQRFSDMARTRRIDLVVFNPGKEGSDLKKNIEMIGDCEGVDDVIVLVPSAEVLNQAAALLRDNSLIMLFAGTPAGMKLTIDASKIYLGNLQITGASGLRFKDIQAAYQLALRDTIDLNCSVAAVGGILAGREAIQAADERRYPGKIIIYPQLEDLPLLGLRELVEKYPNLEGVLVPPYRWTAEAETLLFQQFEN